MTSVIRRHEGRGLFSGSVDLGHLVARYGLVLVLAWIGFGKYVKMESRVLIEGSPLMSWVYHVASVHTVAYTLGTLEIVAAVLIAAVPVAPRLSAIGSATIVRNGTAAR